MFVYEHNSVAKRRLFAWHERWTWFTLQLFGFQRYLNFDFILCDLICAILTIIIRYFVSFYNGLFEFIYKTMGGFSTVKITQRGDYHHRLGIHE